LKHTRLPLTASPALWTPIAGIVLFMRYPDWFMRPRLWAEDFLRFFMDARCDGPAAILEAYSGYLHLLPRLIALAGAWLDPSRIPSFYAYSSLALTLLVVARVFSPRLDLPCKPLIALAIVAAPHTGEVFLCVTNIQWITALALVLTLLMGDPADALDWARDIAILLFAGLTGPFSLFLLPFFVLRALDRSTRASWAILAVVLVTAIVQGWEIYLNAPVLVPDGPGGPIRYLNLAAVLSARIPLGLLGAQGWAYGVGRAFVTGAGILGACAIAAMALARGRYRKERICLVLFIIVLVALSTAKVRTDTWDFREMVQGDRYFFIPRVLLLWIAVCWFCRKPREAPSLALAIAAAGMCCVSIIPYVEVRDPRIRHVERPYFPWAAYGEPLRKGEAVEVEVSPGWKCEVPAQGGQ
jgi:hypothetical protein